MISKEKAAAGLGTSAALNKQSRQKYNTQPDTIKDWFKCAKSSMAYRARRDKSDRGRKGGRQ
jgi:hypothetical protein